jgi:hypothetical protein
MQSASLVLLASSFVAIIHYLYWPVTPQHFKAQCNSAPINGVHSSIRLVRENWARKFLHHSWTEHYFWL